MGDLFRHVAAVLPGFALACLALALLPGPATALVLQRSLRDGRGAGLASVAGNELGLFGWALASGAGLTALLQAHRVLFESMRWVGAGMLVWLGISAWRAAGRAGADPTPMPGLRHASKGAAFRASLLSVAANPKAAVFSFSFFPQFLPPRGSVFLCTVLLATIWILIDGAWCACVAMAATRARSWLARGPVRRWMERAMGAILVALGLELATDSR
ncbi:LysE family translocator [Pendulispora rubella]|uniref:LysE family translocator n=1 Tax=Pendulispora rubella TaxID=2741070 RepID=A0ABZ2KUM1_9BACT